MSYVLLVWMIALAATACPETQRSGAGTACPATTVVNQTGEWTAYDAKTLARAKIRCGFLYPRSPCVSRFEKLAPKTYRVTCAADAAGEE